VELQNSDSMVAEHGTQQIAPALSTASTLLSALILGIGAGTGRDAAWLAEKGHDVIELQRIRLLHDQQVPEWQ
jgi:protein-L-isoaspartate O-methyltransferase